MVKIWSGLIFVLKIAGITVRFVVMFWAYFVALIKLYLIDHHQPCERH